MGKLLSVEDGNQTLLVVFFFFFYYSLPYISYFLVFCIFRKSNGLNTVCFTEHCFYGLTDFLLCLLIKILENH